MLTANQLKLVALGIVLAGAGGNLIVVANNGSVALLGLFVGLVGIALIFINGKEKT